MDNPEVIALLREIRDLHNAQIANHREALENQKVALSVQARMANSQRIGIGMILVALGVWAAFAVR